MTKSRLSTTRELYGLLGSFPNRSAIQKTWNAYFTEQGMDAFCDHYPTTVETLPERLSEMFHFDRRLYLVGEALQEAIVPLLDELDESAQKEQRVNAVWNRTGVLVGHHIDRNLEDAKKILICHEFI